ncbi:MAG: hypothetical protein J3K34DRAFT_401347 [Monoraphidium minutum]|nr:MAG: hypothetical protein J3K34DRAFT_401347 [Monoraphidium minutum]
MHGPPAAAAARCSPQHGPRATKARARRGGRHGRGRGGEGAAKALLCVLGRQGMSVKPLLLVWAGPGVFTGSRPARRASAGRAPASTRPPRMQPAGTRAAPPPKRRRSSGGGAGGRAQWPTVRVRLSWSTRCSRAAPAGATHPGRRPQRQPRPPPSPPRAAPARSSGRRAPRARAAGAGARRMQRRGRRPQGPPLARTWPPPPPPARTPRAI